METIALIGPSGTGKSHRAIKVAHDYNVDIIIDDGLLIRGNQILVGHTAKKQPTRIGAIKAALFLEEEQAEKAKMVIKKTAPERVLILGTSLGMVQKIAANLGLPGIARVINIEEIASRQEIKRAQLMRTRFSKHVIPAPTVEVRKSFPGTLIDPLKVFLKQQKNPGQKSWLEQSVVRPTFTYYGKLTISQNALNAIASKAADDIEGVKSAGKVTLIQGEDGVVVEIHPILYFGTNLNNMSRKIQNEVKDKIEYMTGLSVKSVNVTVKDIIIKNPRGKR